jgi:hypothetical protein
VTEQSQHYPWLCLGICLGGNLGASDFDTIIPLGDRSFELSTEDNLEQFDAIAMPCSDSFQGWIGCGPQCAEKSQRHSDFEIPKRVFGPAGTVVINHRR